MGIIVVPREIEANCYAKFFGGERVGRNKKKATSGLRENYEYLIFK